MQARIPARIRPAMIIARTPFSLKSIATLIINVSASEEPTSTSIAPAFYIEYPIIPMKIAIPIEITTQTDAILLESFNLFSFSIPMKRNKI